MTRRAGARYTTYLPAVGSGQRFALCQAIAGALTAYQEGGQSAFQQLQLIDGGGNFDRVYRSVGDRSLAGGAGDANIIIRITDIPASGIDIRTYSDWSPVSTAGRRQAPATAALARIPNANISDTLEAYLIGFGNAYECSMMLWQPTLTTPIIISIGQLVRHIPARMAGVAHTASSPAPGASRTFNLDRSLVGSLTVGQTIHIYQQTPASEALRTLVTEACTVAAVGDGTVQVTNLVNTFGVGALLGLWPQPTYVMVGTGSGVGYPALSAPVFSMPHQADNGNPGDPSTYFGSVASTLLTSMVPASSRPDPFGLYHAVQVPIFGAGGTAHILGMPEHLALGIPSTGWAAPTDLTTATADFIYPMGAPSSAFIFTGVEYGVGSGRSWFLRYGTPS